MIMNRINKLALWSVLNTLLVMSGMVQMAQAQVSGVAPQTFWRETDQTLPAGLWRIQVNGDTFSIQKNTDATGAFGTVTNLINATSTGVSLAGAVTAGSLGIGGAPTTTLDVFSPNQQAARIRATGATGGYIDFYDSTNSVRRAYMGYGPIAGGTAISDFLINSDGILKLSTGGVATLTIDTSQHVGIGKVPSVPLEVNGEIRDGAVADGAPATQGRITVYYDGSNWATLGYGVDAQMRINYSSTPSAQPLLFGTSTAINNTGTFTTTAKLTAAGALQVLNGTAAAPSFSFLNETDSGLMRNGSRDIRLIVGTVSAITATSTYLQIPNGINIGTSTYNVGLNIQQANAQLLLEKSLAANSNNINFRTAGVDRFIFGTGVYAANDTTLSIGNGAQQIYGFNSNGDFRVQAIASLTPRTSFFVTDWGTDQKKWQNAANGVSLYWSALNDAENAETQWMLVTRGTGTAISSVAFPSSPVRFLDGDQTTPAMSFGSETNLGIYRRGSQVIAIATGGVPQVEVNATQFNLSSSTSLGWSSGALGTSVDTVLVRGAANTLALINGATNAQEFQIGPTSKYVRIIKGTSVGTIRTFDGQHLELGASDTTYLRIEAGTGNFYPVAGSGSLGVASFPWSTLTLGSGAATTGDIRLASGGSVYARNNGNTGNIQLIGTTSVNTVINSEATIVMKGSATTQLNWDGSALYMTNRPGGNQDLGASFSYWSRGYVATLYLDNTVVLAHNNSSFANGAGSGSGTLTNAPSAGNPTKWIAIDDGGTTRYIPAW